jgi:hypothetical protein
MMDSVGTSQQPAPTGDGKDVTTLVIQDLEARATAGENKYGTRLKTHNGRSALIDALQESYDLCVYLRQRVEEDKEDALGGEIDRLRAALHWYSKELQALGHYVASKDRKGIDACVSILANDSGSRARTALTTSK